jgi:hypothetical protein
MDPDASKSVYDTLFVFCSPVRIYESRTKLPLFGSYFGIDEDEEMDE